MPVTYDQLGLDSVLDDGSAFGVLMRRFWPVLLEQAFLDAAETLDVDIAFDLDNPFVQTVLAELALLVMDIAETTRNDIRDLISQQAAAGWSNDELARQLVERGVTESERRATLIARTETARSYSLGSRAAWRASGVVSRSQWLLGNEPCPLCQPLGGKVVSLDDEFAPGVQHPPLHPNCTCAASPVVDR